MQLEIVPKINLFTWKLIRGNIPIKENFKKMGTEINRDCHICGSNLETIDHLFGQ